MDNENQEETKYRLVRKPPNLIWVTNVAFFRRLKKDQKGLGRKKIGIKVVSIARKPMTGVGIGGFDSCRGHQRYQGLNHPYFSGSLYRMVTKGCLLGRR